MKAVIDYETAGASQYDVTVTVSDGTNSANVYGSIIVTPVNEASPTFGADLVATFAENTAVGTSLGTHAATDADASPHGVVSYSIQAGSVSLFC